MTTTLFAIFGIALVATLAWVITRIVNIFVELEEVNEQAIYLTVDIEALKKKVKDLEKRVNVHTQAQALEIIIANIDNERAKANKPSEAHKEKMERVAKYIVLRNEGLSIRKAGEEVGVTYPTAKRYEKQRKAQSNETGNH